MIEFFYNASSFRNLSYGDVALEYLCLYIIKHQTQNVYGYGKDFKNIVQNIFDNRWADFTVHHMEVELRTDDGTQ